MQDQPTNSPVISNPEPRRGFKGLRCPFCGEETIKIDLSDVTTFQCYENDCEFTPADVKEIIGCWQTVLAWVETAPQV